MRATTRAAAAAMIPPVVNVSALIGSWGRPRLRSLLSVRHVWRSRVVVDLPWLITGRHARLNRSACTWARGTPSSRTLSRTASVIAGGPQTNTSRCRMSGTNAARLCGAKGW
jgi:hypothetical protein